MNLYKTLSEKLSKFSPVDFALVASVYVVVSMLIASSYLPLMLISVCFYVIAGIFALFPLTIEALEYKGNYKEKIKKYISHNNPTKQVLTFFACFNLGIILCFTFPALLEIKWFVYVFIGILLAIKPARKTLMW